MKESNSLLESQNLYHASMGAPVTIVSEGRSASIEMQHKPEFGPQRIPIEGLQEALDCLPSC